MSTPSWTIDVAIESKLLNTFDFTQYVGSEGVYNIKVPSGTPKPYLILDTSAEEGELMFGGELYNGVLFMHIWGRSKSEVLRIYSAMHGVIHLKPLELSDGHTLVSGRLRLISVMLDEDGVSYHGVAQFTSISR